MGSKIIAGLLFIFFFAMSVISCPTEDGGTSGGNGTGGGNDGGKENPNTSQPATVSFFNESSFRVDVYKNFNPDYIDPTTLVCSVNPGSTQKITLYASADQKTGDTFYPRYKVLLADSLETGTSNIYVDAQRNLSNISFVVESGKTYTKTIPQPVAGELKFINGYIAVQNIGAAQIQIHKGSDVLPKLDDDSLYLNPGQNLGYYEIKFSQLDGTLTINQLKAFGSSYADFPEFVMERGKLFKFAVNNTVVTGPEITNINPLR